MQSNRMMLATTTSGYPRIITTATPNIINLQIDNLAKTMQIVTISVTPITIGWNIR